MFFAARKTPTPKERLRTREAFFIYNSTQTKKSKHPEVLALS